jgi:O-antigen ligase
MRKQKPKTKKIKLPLDPIAALFFLLLLLLPTQLGKHFFLPFSYLSGVRVDYLSPTLYLIDLVILALFFLNIKSVIGFFKNKMFFYLIILLGFNIALAKNPALAAYGTMRIVELLVVVALMRPLIKTLSPMWVMGAFAASGVVELGLSITQFIIKQSVQGPFYFLGERLFSLGTPGVAKIAVNGLEFLRPYGTFSHPNSMAGFYLLVYFFVLINKRFDRHLALKYLSLTVFSALILISFSKTAILAFLVLNVLYVFLNRNLCRICMISRIIVLGVLSAIFLFPTGDPMTLLKRFELGTNSLTIMATNPLTGTGLNNYLLSQSQFTSRFPLFFNQPVHNIFLLFLAETGLIGGFILFKLGKIFKNNFSKNQWLLVGVVLMTGMVDHYWLTLIQNFLLMGVVLSLTGFQGHASPGDSKPQSASAVRQIR